MRRVAVHLPENCQREKILGSIPCQLDHSGVSQRPWLADKHPTMPEGSLTKTNEVNQNALLVWYPDPEALLEAWSRDLALGALFVPTVTPYDEGDRVRVVIELPFCEGSVDVYGEVVGAITAEMAITGATAGISVRTDLPISELRDRMEALTGLILPETAEDSPLGRDRAPRYPAETAVTIEADGRNYKARSVDLSYNGMLALLDGIDLGEDKEVAVALKHPRNGQALMVSGKIARQTRCDHGIMAIGIRFNYGFDDVDRVTKFIDDLRGFSRARKLTSITGALRDSQLEVVLETFSSVSNQGTLLLSRGSDQGRIGYSESEIVFAVTGLVTGTKALGRMFTWTDALFEFQPYVDPDEETIPLPLDSAIVTAAIECDELNRIDIKRLVEAESLTVNETRLCEIRTDLGPVHGEIAENAAMGFSPIALLDILPESDATIFQALADLIDAGALSLA